MFKTFEERKKLYFSIKWLKTKVFKLPIFYFLSPDFAFFKLPIPDRFDHF
jgi:hypothetical protein